MINTEAAYIHKIAIHKIGNGARDEALVLSSSPMDIEDVEMEAALIRYFTAYYKEPKYHEFTSATDEPTLNPLYNFCTNLLADEQSLQEESVRIAKTLYEKSNHPSIKSGTLFIAFIHDILIEDEMMDAIGIIKSENKDDFFDLTESAHQLSIAMKSGFKLGKPDKACLVLNTLGDQGFRILTTDFTNQTEAQYWTNEFLDIKVSNDDYQQTTSHIQLTKTFIKDLLPHIDEMEKVDEIDVLHRSKTYFQQEESFTLDDYASKVFPSQDSQEAFASYAKEAITAKGLRTDESFDIRKDAVKKNQRVFKSVIKLDKNFHIYCHGDKSKIVKGEEENGQKFYKIYYDNEQ